MKDDLIERPRKPTCSCLEIHGEDPDCIKHGRGTEWRRAHPDLCELIEERDRLRAALTPFSDACKWAADDYDDDERPNWSPFIPVGRYRAARAALNPIGKD